MSSVQLQFDYQRATKLWMLERLRCSMQVKAVLKAIDGFARDNASATVTLRLLAQSIGASIVSARRHVKAAEQAGYLIVDRTDRSASTYTIQWLPIFDQTHSKTGDEADQKTSASRVSTPSQNDSPPSQIERGPPVRLRAPPSQVERGAPPPTINANSSTRPWRPKAKTPRSEEPIGGLFRELAERRQQPATSGQPRAASGQPVPPSTWLNHVGILDLGDPERLVQIFRRAVNATVLPPVRESLVIVLAAAHHVLNGSGIQNRPGMFRSIIEGPSRFRLTRADFDHARDVARQLSQTAGVLS